MERKPLNVKIPENIHDELESRGENKTKATITALENYLWGADDNGELEHLKELIDKQEQHYKIQLAEKDKQMSDKNERIADLKSENERFTAIVATMELSYSELKDHSTKQFSSIKEAYEGQKQLYDDIVQKIQDNYNIAMANVVSELKNNQPVMIEAPQEEKKGILSKIFG